MAKENTKPTSNKRVIPLRSAGEKVIRDDERPSKSLFDEYKRQAAEEINPQDPTQPSQTSQINGYPINSQDFPEHSIAPTKNFQKVPNSIANQAIPQGLFRPGKSKHLYDVLYSLTRGAITPARKIRINKAELMKKAGIGSRITFDSCIAHLQQVGLLKVHVFTGQHSGNEFEIATPEEAATLTSQTSQTSLTSPAQKLVRLVRLETSQTRQPLVIENKDTSSNPKTFFKDIEEKSDDEPQAAVRAFFRKIDQVFLEKAGRGINVSDEKDFEKIGELLAAEIEEAMRRTKFVTNPAKFALTHLRRRLGIRSVDVEPGANKTSKQTKQEIRLTDDEIQSCPDCKGRLVIYPNGKERGVMMCKHQPLIAAKQQVSRKSKL